MDMLLITGVNGFIGTHIANRFRQADMAVRGLVRTGREEPQIEFLKSIGVQIHPADLSSDAAWDEAMAGVDQVAHLIGSIQPPRSTSFEAMHVGLSRQCVEAAKRAGVKRIVFLSAVNSAPGAVSQYYATKGQAEELFRSSGLPYAVVRPGLVCGHGAGRKHSKLMMKLLGMARHESAFKTVGDGQGKVQPMHVLDLAEAVFQVVTRDDCAGKEFDVAGPEVMTTNQMIHLIAHACACPDKPIRHIPKPIARIAAFVAERVSANPILTTDQIRTMSKPMLADPCALEREFGITPRTFDDALKDYADVDPQNL
jgi:nucleoside-diphosphate-sugar epimerase